VNVEVDLPKKVRPEPAINEGSVQPPMDAIIKGARTNRIGNEMVFVVPLERCARIRTREKGRDAIG